jgi:tetratricopeptide (TPR) repeat protein
VSLSIGGLVTVIPEWLALTRARDVSVGLSDEEALRRALVLRVLLREGRVSGADVVLDEDLKDVFWALVVLVTEKDPRAGSDVVQEANAAYHFLTLVEWSEDDFGEKRHLLRSLAQAGCRVLGSDVETVGRRRAQFEDGVALDKLGSDPLSGEWEALLPRVASLLRTRNSSPSAAYREAVTLFSVLKGAGQGAGLFDERFYLMGSLAASAGAAARQLGRLDEAQEWFAISEGLFGKTLAPAPLVAIVGYGRLCLLFERDEYEQILEFEPSVSECLRRNEVHSFLRKCEFVRAKSLRILGRRPEARELLESIRLCCILTSDGGLEALVLICLADLIREDCRFAEALELLQRAGALLQETDYVFAKAELNVVLGDLLRQQSKLLEAIPLFRSAVSQLRDLGMARWEAYDRLLLAETLLACNRPQEAEAELLQALPTMESLRIVPEGLAAVALLQESLRRRKADPKAVSALRECLQRQR